MNQKSIKQRKLEQALAFTRAYQNALNEHPAVREALCLAQQYPALCLEIQDHHLFAGRKLYQPFVGFLASLNTNVELKALYD